MAAERIAELEAALVDERESTRRLREEVDHLRQALTATEAANADGLRKNTVLLDRVKALEGDPKTVRLEGWHLAVAAEREACAKMAEVCLSATVGNHAWESCQRAIAAAIRARAEVKP